MLREKSDGRRDHTVAKELIRVDVCRQNVSIRQAHETRGLPRRQLRGDVAATADIVEPGCRLGGGEIKTARGGALMRGTLMTPSLRRRRGEALSLMR